MIFGLASHHGHVEDALNLFESMKKEGIVVPNGVTFVGILSASCHADLIDVGREVFCSMKVVYGIEPKIEHYGCMVDHLGRGRGTYKRDAMETRRGCYFGIFAGI